MVEVQHKPVEVIGEFVEPTEKGYCPECKRKMIKLGDNFKCIKCGITVELAK